jgi:hypothetical protein
MAVSSFPKHLRVVAVDDRDRAKTEWGRRAAGALTILLPTITLMTTEDHVE